MAVPTRTEALSLLVSTSPSPRLVQHVTVVAEVASFLAYRAAQAGLTVDRRLAETAALLHDVDKALPRDHPLKELGHGAAGAAWLTEAGHPELARTLMAHPVARLTDPEALAWVNAAPIEERIVTYADKRATQRVVSLRQRFDRWARRHPEDRAQLERAYAVAEHLEDTLCAAIGIQPTDVERLRWVDEAMTRALATGVAEGGTAGSAAAPAAPRAAAGASVA
jgi:putative nucleotidyltransferase with HDIG domain